MAILMIDAIRDGMAKAADNKPLQLLGELLTDWMLAHPAECEKDAGDKTLEGAMDSLRKEAKKQGGNCGVISDMDGLQIALRYLGVGGTDDEPTLAKPAPAANPFDLDALMGL